MKKVIIWIRLARPLIMFISVFGAMVGLLNVTIADIPSNKGVELEAYPVIMVIFGAISLAAGLMIHNDYTDLESDRINRPHKPLPSGEIKPLTAKWVGIGLMLLSILIGFATNLNRSSINWVCGIFTFIIVFIGILYNNRGKYMGIWGHMMVAFGVGAIPLWGAVAHRPFEPGLIFPLSIGLFIMEIGREIMVCSGDMRGDIAAGFSTTPIRLGRIKAMKLALIFYILSVPVFYIPYFGWLGFAKIFSEIYFCGATFFLLVLFITWFNVMRVVKRGEEKAIWRAFELNIRTGTRLGVVIFQILIFLDAFY